MGLIRWLIFETIKQSVLDAINQLPTISTGGFGPSVDPNNVVDIESIFKQHVKTQIFGSLHKIGKSIVETKLPADMIIPTQDYVFRSGIIRYVEDPPEQLPLVVLCDGKYYATDHTRIASQIMSGKSMIDVRLVEYDKSAQRYKKPRQYI